MGKLLENIIFSFFVSLVMVVLDALYHLATETAVHINYAAVKFVVIYIVVFLVAYWVGKSKIDGIFTSIAGPIIFYIYYIFANPTLNREIFKIDENFGYIFVHIAAMFVAYFAVYHFWWQKKGSALGKSLAYAFIVALCIFGLDVAYQLSYIQFTTHNEEVVARVLSFATSVYLVILLFALVFVLHYFVKNKIIEKIIIIIGSVIIIYLIGQNLIRSLVGVASSFIQLYLANIYLKQK